MTNVILAFTARLLALHPPAARAAQAGRKEPG
jgi:hypothetical protein